MPLAPTSAPAVGTLLDGKYRVERVLGEGGMGMVVAARHVQLDQPFALKLLLPQYCQHAEAVQRFLREARSAARIQSEHVARVSDVGTLADGVPFMVMELLEGRDLDRELQERGPLPIGDAVSYVMQACGAVAEAHALGIVHRDLKPANLFLTRRRDGSALVKVLDFGISKATEPDAIGGAEANLTSTAVVMGSPQYMSPEQIRSAKHVDARSDVWSLGAVLYELLAGKPAFDAESAPATLAKIVADEAPPLGDARTDLPAGLEAIVRRCLMKDREQRFQSVAELARALAPFAHAAGASTARIPFVSAPSSVKTVVSQPTAASQPTPVSGERTPETAAGANPRAAGRSRELRAWPWVLALAAAGLVAGVGWLVRDEAPAPEPVAEPPEAKDSNPSIAAALVSAPPSPGASSVAPPRDAGAKELAATPAKATREQQASPPPSAAQRPARPAPAPKPKKAARPSKGRDLFADPK